MVASNYWAMYFATIVGMKLHPGNKEPLNLMECKRLADNMFVITHNTFKQEPPSCLSDRPS